VTVMPSLAGGTGGCARGLGSGTLAATDAIAKRGARPYGTNYKKASSKNPLFLGLARRKPRKVSLAHRA
jgi:hypothetical protein